MNLNSFKHIASFKRIIISLLLFCYTFYISKAGEVEIKGNALSHANSEYNFYIFSDPFIKKPEVIAHVKLDNTGNFIVKFELDSIKQIFMDIGIYRGTLYAEPGKSYTVSFPEKKDKSKADQLNPFFEPVEFHLPVTNISSNDLNFKIVAFNNAYYPYLDKFTLNLRTGTKKSVFDSAVFVLKSINPDSGDFYKNYVKYKLGYLKHLAYQQKSKSISKEYFQTAAVLYNNPAYTELLNQVYYRYFYFFGRSLQGKKIFDDINKSKSYYSLTQTLKTDSVLLSDSLREMVILKNIYDEFYASNFSRTGLLQILDSLSTQTKINQSRVYAFNIREKITRLMPGFAPPDFELKDQQGQMQKLSNFAGYYVYMGFCTSSSYSCIKEFDALLKMYEKYKNIKLLIITLSNDDNWEAMADFVKKSGYPWMFLYVGDSQHVLEKYDIRAYPTYFLVGPDGKLIFSPAISPAEGFEMKLFQVMRSNGDI